LGAKAKAAMVKMDIDALEAAREGVAAAAGVERGTRESNPCVV
jgi:hypothetical protein